MILISRKQSFGPHRMSLLVIELTGRQLVCGLGTPGADNTRIPTSANIVAKATLAQTHTHTESYYEYEEHEY